jgi:hypothetical protein
MGYRATSTLPASAFTVAEFEKWLLRRSTDAERTRELVAIATSSALDEPRLPQQKTSVKHAGATGVLTCTRELMRRKWMRRAGNGCL